MKTLKYGDHILINFKLLSPIYDGYSTDYIFGGLENKFGKPNIDLNDVDVIKVITEDKEILLKRLYG